MDTLTVRACAFEELEAEPNFSEMLEEYADECAIHGMPRPCADRPTYRALTAAGAFQFFGCWDGDELIGFVNILAGPLPHYAGNIVASTESYFVQRDKRSTGAGIRLLREAEMHAKAKGACGLLVSAPVGGSLDAAMSRSSRYRPSNRVYFRPLQ